MILANKQDLPGALSVAQISEVLVFARLFFHLHSALPAHAYDARTFHHAARWKQVLGLAEIRSHHWHIQGCSAVTGAKLLEGIDWLVSDVSSRIYLME